MRHYLAFSILLMVSLLMACCITSAIQRVAPNLANQAGTAVATRAEGLGQNLAETLLPSMDVSTAEVQAQTMMATLMPSMDVSTLESQAQTLVATAVAGIGQQVESTPQPPAPNSGGQAPTGVPSDFPVTPDAANLQVLATGDNAQINYQTKLSIPEVIGYCTVFALTQGWQLRSNLTAQTDTTFSIVFQNSSNPKNIVVQGVKVGNLTNVNVRYEAVK